MVERDGSRCDGGSHGGHGLAAVRRMTADFLAHLGTHVALSAGALAIALAIGLPLGTWIARSGAVRAPAPDSPG